MSYRVRPDTVTNKRMRNAVLLFVIAMACVGGSMAWTIASNKGQGGEAGGPQSISVCCSLVCLFAVVPYVFYARLRMGFLYRCPQCGTRIRSPLPTAADEGRPIRHRCDRCRVEWDTGWTYARSGD